jgi:hypothetical protein
MGGGGLAAWAGLYKSSPSHALYRDGRPITHLPHSRSLGCIFPALSHPTSRLPFSLIVPLSPLHPQWSRLQSPAGPGVSDLRERGVQTCPQLTHTPHADIGREVIDVLVATGKHEVILLSRSVGSPFPRCTPSPPPWDPAAH